MLLLLGEDGGVLVQSPGVRRRLEGWDCLKCAQTGLSRRGFEGVAAGPAARTALRRHARATVDRSELFRGVGGTHPLDAARWTVEARIVLIERCILDLEPKSRMLRYQRA